MRYFLIVIVNQMNCQRQISQPKRINNRASSTNNTNSKLSSSKQPKQRIKTENSPPKSLSKQQIRNTIKKIVCNHQINMNSINKGQRINISSHEQQHRNRKAKSKIQLSIPYIENSFTPKHRLDKSINNDRQVKSTKAADGIILTTSGRYDLKQLFKAKNSTEQSNQIVKKDNFIKESTKIELTEKDDQKFRDSYLNLTKYQEVRYKKQEQFNVKECLSFEEYEKFGDRFPENFKRLGLLGRGGFSVVWLGIHRTTKRKFAIKQILTNNPHETHLKEIWFGSYFFDKGGHPREEFEDHVGINNICKLISYEIKNTDSWLYYQILQDTLGSSLFDIKSQMLNGEKIYKVHFKEYISRIRSNIYQLKLIIIEIAKALHLINSHNIVHSDLKTQNILLKTRKSRNSSSESPYLKQLKLIDFGSSFLFTNLKQFSMATPEYMPPQILNYILFQNKLDYDGVMLQKMQKYKKAWVVDIWSLGCIVLEIVSGIPLWMSVPSRIENTNKLVTGLFAVKGRLFNKIIGKQIQVVKNLNSHLTKDNYSGIVIDEEISFILTKMLSLNPDERISPLQILHYFGVACKPQRIPSY